MSNILTDVRLALITRLETITTNNGYLTNVGGNVKSGWLNEIIKDQAVPAGGLVVVQRAPGGEPRGGAASLKLPRGFRVVGAVNASLDGYESDLDDIELDLLRCLMPEDGVHVPWLPRGCSAFRVGRPESFPPGEGLPAATTLLPITLDIIVNGQ